MKIMLSLAALSLPTFAFAATDPECEGQYPDPYNEQLQVDYLLNYIALATSYSPLHAPIPHKPGHGAVGLDLAIIPPLSCARRFALGRTKTEETNQTPVAPRPRITFALPLSDNVVPYAGVAFFPPIKVLGTRNTIMNAEAGVGVRLGEAFQVGGRFHATTQKTVADAATPIDGDEAGADDLYLATTLGIDASVGYELAEGKVTPYFSAGITDVTTFFWIGEGGVVSNNWHPYLGPVFSLGLDGLFKERIRYGAEFYAAPGGHSVTEPGLPTLPGFGTYGHLYTARVRIAFEI